MVHSYTPAYILNPKHYTALNHEPQALNPEPSTSLYARVRAAAAGASAGAVAGEAGVAAGAVAGAVAGAAWLRKLST